MLIDISLLVGSYLVGAIPFGYLLAKVRTGQDIRTQGSGNIGATNVMRTQGKLFGLLTLLLDFGKAALCVYLCRRFGTQPWMASAGGCLAIVGHCYPVYIGFRGGKGVASALGAFVFLSPAAALGALVVWVLEIVILRWVSLGSILACLAFSGFLFLFRGLLHWEGYDLATCLLGTATALLIIYRHKSNISNLLKGTEQKIWGEKAPAIPVGQEQNHG